MLAYLVARRWRAGALFGAAIVPSLLVLALWKDGGSGDSPRSASRRRASPSARRDRVSVDLDRYLDLDLDHWLKQMDQLRESSGARASRSGRRSPGSSPSLRVRRGAIAALLAGWLAAFLVVKGFSPRADIRSGSFWRLLMPAWPAYLLLVAAIPLLVPTLARRLGDACAAARLLRSRSAGSSSSPSLTVLVPAVAIAASSPLEGPGTRCPGRRGQPS